jgi:hypothetical protein
MFLVAAIVAIVLARRDIASTEAQREAAHRIAATKYQGATGLDALSGQFQQLKSELESRSLAEEVFDSPWVEMLSIVGTAFLATSFYAEAIIKMRPQPQNETPKRRPSLPAFKSLSE